MKKSMYLVLVSLLGFLSYLSVAFAETAAPGDVKKHTEAGKYVTALEAYDMWKANPDKIKILDCRIQEEYAFVGHAAMAYNC